MSIYKQPLRSDEIYHHGVMGMKWGEHRFQREDGTLTDKGKKRFDKVGNSKIRQLRDTRAAKSVFKKNAKAYERYANAFDKHAQKQLKKSQKYDEGSKKYEKRMSSSEEYGKLSKKFRDAADVSRTKLSEIDSGKIKAGRDFIVQRDHNIHLSNMGLGRDYAESIMNANPRSKNSITLLGTTKDRTVIEKNKKAEDKKKKDLNKQYEKELKELELLEKYDEAVDKYGIDNVKYDRRTKTYKSK